MQYRCKHGQHNLPCNSQHLSQPQVSEASSLPATPTPPQTTMQQQPFDSNLVFPTDHPPEPMDIPPFNAKRMSIAKPESPSAATKKSKKKKATTTLADPSIPKKRNKEEVKPKDDHLPKPFPTIIPKIQKKAATKPSAPAATFTIPKKSSTR